MLLSLYPMVAEIVLAGLGPSWPRPAAGGLLPLWSCRARSRGAAGPPCHSPATLLQHVQDLCSLLPTFWQLSDYQLQRILPLLDIWQYLEMFGAGKSTTGEGIQWHLLGKCQECCWTFYSGQGSPSTANDFPPWMSLALRFRNCIIKSLSEKGNGIDICWKIIQTITLALSTC